MKLLLRVFLALIALIIVMIGAAPFLLPSGWVAEKVVEQVRIQTGRTLAFSGDASLRLFPDISLALKDAKLSNPPGMPDGFVLATETLYLKVALGALLARNFKIKEFLLEKPVVNLLVTGDGKSNWRFSETHSNADQNSGTLNETVKSLKATELTLGAINIRQGSLRYLDERTGTVIKADDINAQVSMPRLDGPVTLKGDLVWNRQKTTFNFKADRPALLAEDLASKVSFELNGKPVSLGFAGNLSLAQGLHLSGDVNLKTPSLRDLAKWAGSPLAPGKGLGSFSVSSSLAYGNGTINLKKAKIMLDGMNIQGRASVVLKEAVPQIVAHVGVDKVNVNTYTASATSAGSKTKRKGKWSTVPIDMSGLRALNADISLNAGQIIYQKTIVSDASVRLKLSNGVLDSTLSKMSFYGGNAEGALRLDGTREVPVISGSLRADGVNSYQFLRDFAELKWLEGTMSLTTQISATGANQAQLVSSLDGTFGASLSNGAIRGVNIARIIRGALKSILAGWKTGASEKTGFSAFRANFKISRGIARNYDLKLIGPLVRLSGNGLVNLPAKTLNYKIKPKLVASLKGQGGIENLFSIDIPFRVKGSWSNPQIYPDIEGILDNPEKAFKALDKLLQGQSGLQGLDSKAIKNITKEIDKAVGKQGAKNLEKVGKKLFNDLFK